LNLGQFHFIFLLSLFRSENHVCLSRGVQEAGATWRAATRIVVRVGDLVQRTGDDRTGRILGGRTIERSGGAMCGLHRVRGDEDCDDSMTFRGLNSNAGYFGGFTFIFVSCGELRLLVSRCAGDRCNMPSRDEDHGRSRRPGVEDRGWSSTSRVLGCRTIEMSGDIVSGLHRTRGDEERMFIG
jgi:hypothetical protein